MEQLDICRLGANRNGRAGDLVVVLQHRMMDQLGTCVVAPVLPLSQLPIVDRLRPVVTLDGVDHVIAVDRLAAISRRAIGAQVGSAAPLRAAVIAALDLLFTGI